MQLSSLAALTAVPMPSAYSARNTTALRCGKNAAAKAAYTGAFALQLIHGVSRIVSTRSRRAGSVRAASTAGTLHPKPSSSGTALCPLSPKRRSGRSVTKATRAR